MNPSNQTSVSTVTVGGAATVVLLWVAGEAGVEMTEIVAGAIVVLGTALVGLFRR
jgi:hypothetical protein